MLPVMQFPSGATQASTFYRCNNTKAVNRLKWGRIRCNEKNGTGKKLKSVDTAEKHNRGSPCSREKVLKRRKAENEKSIVKVSKTLLTIVGEGKHQEARKMMI